MATSTERFGFTKPAGSDPASVVPLNSNTDLIEQYLGRTQDMIAPMYDDTATYDVGDIVTYESNLYKCITAISTAETFDPTKWEETTATQEGGGGGGGSSVIPNPTGTPTDTLNTIGIDGTIYGIEGGGSISGEGVEIYSEDEYIVGKWIDGKKLYQKTFSLPSATILQANDWTTINDVVVQDANRCIQTDVYLGADDSQSSVFGKFSNGVLSIFSDIQLSINAVTIRYTKTVETPAPAWGGSVTNNYANFIDTDNVIDSGVYNPTTPLSYTATEDCFVVIALIANNNPCIVSVDNKEIYRIYDNGIGSITVPVPMKKGQTITATTSYSAEDSPYTVYGITYASGGSEAPATDASEVDYDSTTSQLTADNVQDALDEIVANADTASEDILTLQNVQGYDAYDETQTYAVGDYAIYNNHVYECTTAVSTAEPFDSTKWSETSIEQIIDGVKSDVTQLNSSIATLNTITSGNGTRNTSISSNGLLSYSIIANKFVLWRLSDLVISTATSTHGTNIFVGLPSGNGGTNLIHRRDSSRSIRVVIRDNAMKLHYDELTVSANEIYGSGWYILNS